MSEPLDRLTLARLVEEARTDRDRYREALERLTDALTGVQVSGIAARTCALHEAWKAAREALDA